MWRAGLVALLMLMTADAAQAQFWGGSPYGRGGYYRQQPSYGWPWDDDYAPRRRGPLLSSGGERPAIDRLRASPGEALAADRDRIAEWPDWHPPEEMRWRDPRLPEKMTGGIKNPLGAMALYLGSSLYRIHGTNDASSIGRAASSGCFRMLNGHIVDLAARVDVGTNVQVVHRLPPELEKVVADQVAPAEAPKPALTKRSRPS